MGWRIDLIGSNAYPGYAGDGKFAVENSGLIQPHPVVLYREGFPVAVFADEEEAHKIALEIRYSNQTVRVRRTTLKANA